jgi:hypothetical protein
VLLWSLLAVFWFLNLNPFTGRALRPTQPRPVHAENLGVQSQGLGLTVGSTRTQPRVSGALP